MPLNSCCKNVIYLHKTLKKLNTTYNTERHTGTTDKFKSGCIVASSMDCSCHWIDVTRKQTNMIIKHCTQNTIWSWNHQLLWFKMYRSEGLSFPTGWAGVAGRNTKRSPHLTWHISRNRCAHRSIWGWTLTMQERCRFLVTPGVILAIPILDLGDVGETYVWKRTGMLVL